jgi:hypothetical protein
MRTFALPMQKVNQTFGPSRRLIDAAAVDRVCEQIGQPLSPIG